MNAGTIRVHFLVGMSRSGITWLSRMLNLHPEVSVFGQSRFWGKHYIPPGRDGFYREEHRLRLARKVRTFEWNATVGDEAGCFRGLGLAEFRKEVLKTLWNTSLPITPDAMFLRIAETVARLKSARIVIEKTPHHVLYAWRIQEYLPHAKFVVLWCDAANYIRAMKSQKDLIYHPAAAAILWRRYNAACTHLLRGPRGQALLVRYNDVKQYPNAELLRILRYLELPFTECITDLPKLYDGFLADAVSADLTASDWFWAYVINGVRRAKAPLPVGGLREIVGTIFSLPLFGIRHLWQDWSQVEGSRLHYYSRWLANGEERS